MEETILTVIGSDLLSVLTPVSICMFLVVLLITTLSPPHSSPPPPPPQLITAANLVYSELPSDTPAHKLLGALENAAVFILLIAALTFLLVLLYYYNFTNFLTNYMRFSTFVILSTMGGSIFLSLIRHYWVPLDVVNSVVGLLNFAVVGVVAVFGRGVPIVVTQGYTVALGIITAAWFTQLPEWTTWVLLVALAVYDLVAVLAPGGPLKILVELAQERDGDLPALVYEARPRVSGGGGRRGRAGGVEMQGLSRNEGGDGGSNVGVEGGRHVEVEIGMPALGSREIGVGNEEREVPALGSREIGVGNEEREVPALGSREIGVVNEEREVLALGLREIGVGNEERAPLVVEGRREGEGEEEEGMTRGIKLGLGDFVFYSVLVGRAAMYDLMTVYACYLAIISGLACTLILLSVWRRALPALPISITLGVVFYFLTRLLMEPFVVGISSNLLMF